MSEKSESETNNGAESGSSPSACCACAELQDDIRETSRQLELMTQQRDKAKILMEHAISVGCRHIKEARTLLELSAEIIEDERLKERIADFLSIGHNE